MSGAALASALIEQEARALLTRLARVRPFALHETMVPAAMPVPASQARIERFLIDGRAALACRVVEFLRWMHGPGRREPASVQQRRLTLIRLRFNDVLSQFDLFTEVITQRSEHETGVWLSGLDVVARDALALPVAYREPPPVVCYLARGPGAAIRRASTRLPGGDANPVAIIRIPRERMVGHGIAASLVHEVGHQAAALLDLVPSLRPVLASVRAGRSGPERQAWAWFERWVSEVVADLWSVARLGIGAPLGLIGVVSLPRWFVFRFGGEDPHPVPWIRVLISCALGDALYPDPQWRALADGWRAMYPPRDVATEQLTVLHDLVDAIPGLVDVLLGHRPAALRGRSLGAALHAPDRTARNLLRLHDAWSADPAAMDATPTLAFAVLGQARASGRLTPERESRLVAGLLTRWALRSTLDTSAICADLHPPAAPARALSSVI